MIRCVRNVIAVVLGVMAGGTATAEPLTARDLDSARAFLGMDDMHPNVLEVNGWRTDADETAGEPVEVYAYGSLLQPGLLLNRLCVVETRWIQGVVVEDEVKWAPELFQVRYEVWESARPVCAIGRRSQIPEHVSLRAMIDGASLLRILDGSDELLQQALTFLPEDKRLEHRAARLIEVTISDFTYSAMFRSGRNGGIAVRFSEAQEGFGVHSAGEYLY